MSDHSKRVVPSILALLLVASMAAAQPQPQGAAPQASPSGGMNDMQQMMGGEGGRGTMSGGQMMGGCPMSGGGMCPMMCSKGAMVAGAVVGGGLALAAIFALVALGLFLLRRSHVQPRRVS